MDPGARSLLVRKDRLEFADLATPKAIKARWKALFDEAQMRSTWAGGKDEGTIIEAELQMGQVLAARLLLQGRFPHIDKLQLLDVGIGTVLADVLGHSWRMGGAVVAMSNKVPGELYKNGLGAEHVRGFVDALEARSDVVRVGGGRVWRWEEVGGRSGWYLVGEGRFEEVVRKVVKGRENRCPPEKPNV
ncbi:hypothetical protein FS749_004564 [Ceratobasidium sp. UAMH 11750]|nr:hypothetical protein FS749_004564 [Ceratobasidium sp. UAMH 11750]